MSEAAGALLNINVKMWVLTQDKNMSSVYRSNWIIELITFALK